jgi:trehalose 6-phosphate synthase/phosphatase
MAPMRDRVMTFDAAWWARSFVDDLRTRHIGSDAPTNTEQARQRLATAVRERKPVALFLDYDGTLREIESTPAAARPSAGVHHVLGMLRDRAERDGNLDITIISGRTPADLDSFLGDYPFGMIAEHGATLRRPGTREWDALDRNVDYRWIHELLNVLRVYEASTPGSFIERKRTSLVWHYRRADPEFGEWKAKQLFEELSAVTANDPLHVRHGRKIVEITAAGINKGAAILRLLEEKTYDLILVAGDDQTDESMFRLDLRNLVSIKVGDGDTQATYRLPTPAALRKFLADAMR